MFNYLSSVNTKEVKTKVSSFDYFYWKYIYGDIIISKFINFLVKSGYKNRAIKYFLKALSNLKNKFGINPILLVKYIILKRNVLHKVTKKKVKKKTFFYLRLLDFEKQISSTIKKIMGLVLHLKDKKQLKLWQSIFLILLNFCILKTKTKKKNSNLSFFSDGLFISKIYFLLHGNSISRLFKSICSIFVRMYTLLKSSIYLLNQLLDLFKFIKQFSIVGSSVGVVDCINQFKITSYFKLVRSYLSYFRIYFFYFNYYNGPKLLSYKKKISFFFRTFLRLKKKYLTRKIQKFKKFLFFKKQLLKNKVLFKAKYKQHFLTRFFFKELNDFKKASKFKNSFLNFKLRNKKKKELSIGTRIHAKHDIRLRHRKIFFRVSKYGQLH